MPVRLGPGVMPEGQGWTRVSVPVRVGQCGRKTRNCAEPSAQKGGGCMSIRTRPRIPTYRLHKQSGQAVVTLSDGQGGRRDVLLGNYGTEESKAEYQRVLLEWEANGRRLPARQEAADLTVAEVIERYWRHVGGYYRHADGTPTSEVTSLRYSL